VVGAVRDESAIVAVAAAIVSAFIDNLAVVRVQLCSAI
jgi:hypothetical protein